MLAIGLPIAEVQRDLFGILTNRTKASQGFLFLPSFRFSLNQTQPFSRQPPGMGIGLRKTGEPAFVLIE
jgi:hypothetical protein